MERSRQRLLTRAQALAARLPHLGVGPDLCGLSLSELWGAHCFLARLAAQGTLAPVAFD